MTLTRHPQRPAAAICAMLILFALSCGLTSPAMAQLDWGVISTSGDPDPVTVFDLSNPGASNQLLGFVDGNFNRSFDFDSPDSFYYYVSTDSLNDPGDRGLWYWDNNVNTQLTTVDFSDSGDGGGTLSADFSRYFVTVTDTDTIAGDSLYVFDNLGGTPTFTEIGETGLSQLMGLAADPVSGDLYAYDSGTEALYTLDPMTAVPTLVGFSQTNLGAIGGMDFNGDGSILLLSSGNDLFTVDKLTGSLTPAGDVIVNTSGLSYRVVPEPSAGTLLLLLLGLAASAFRGRAAA